MNDQTAQRHEELLGRLRYRLDLARASCAGTLEALVDNGWTKNPAAVMAVKTLRDARDAVEKHQKEKP